MLVADAILAEPFGGIKPLIRERDDLFERDRLPVAGEPDADGYPEAWRQGFPIVVLDGFTQFFAESGPARHTGFRENNHELFPAIPADDIYRPAACSKNLGDRPKYRIPELVRKPVIDMLEIVHVD